MPLEPEEKLEIERVVAEAVRQTLIALGINAGDPLEMQKDMMHLRSWRKSTEDMKGKGMLVATTVIVSGLMGALWLGISELIKR